MLDRWRPDDRGEYEGCNDHLLLEQNVTSGAVADSTTAWMYEQKAQSSFAEGRAPSGPNANASGIANPQAARSIGPLKVPLKCSADGELGQANV